RRLVGELDEVDHPRRLGPYLVEIFRRHHDVAPLLELVPLHDFGVGHFTVAVRAPALLLDARLAFAMELVEGDGPAGFRGREHLDGDVHQADLEEALPGRSRSHRPIIGPSPGTDDPPATTSPIDHGPGPDGLPVRR